MTANSVFTKKPGLLCSARLNLAILMFLGCAVLYALRGNISFALVCMVDSNAGNDSLFKADTILKCESNSTFLDFFKSSNKSDYENLKGEFNWSKKIQGTILSAFFFGYMTSQILGGYLAEKLGAKRIIGVSIFACSVLTLFTPAATRVDLTLLIFLRAVLGFLQGVIFPSMQAMWALWSPPLERGLLTGLSYAGSQIGNVLVMPISGILCRHGFSGGWPSIFYILGGISIIWCFLWIFFVADTPQKHRRISNKERNYIIQALGMKNHETDKTEEDDNETDIRYNLVQKVKIPWRSIFTSKPVWACFVGHFAGDWAAYTMATGLPLFMNDVLGLDFAAMGMLSALPYIAYFISINVGGFLADYLQENAIFSTLNTRRLAMIIALFGQGFFLILIGYMDCGKEHWLVLFLILSLGLSGLQYSGFIVNYLDICPLFAGTVAGIGQTISCLGGIISPLAIGFLTPTNTIEEWRHVFYLTAFVLIVGAVIFCVFASGSVQSWSDPCTSNVEEDEKRTKLNNTTNEKADAELLG